MVSLMAMQLELICINFKLFFMKTSFYKFMYAAFLLLGAYYVFVQKDYSSAVSNIGIALAFDPFNQAQPWNERPKWQKAWLIIHLACVAALFGFMVGLGDKT